VGFDRGVHAVDALANSGIFAPSVGCECVTRRTLLLDVASQVKTVIDQTGMDPASLELEITESSMMDNMDEAIRDIEKLRALGVKISIDDFGTGYSSLSYLKMLPVDSVKIDRSFIRDLNESSQGAISLVRAIITLAHDLNLKVVAEGVEKEEQVRILTHLNCDLIQGFLFYKPLNAAIVGEILEENELHRNDTRKKTPL
jgi:EAL domain-containing protein (putative c-di-GMP-specific phosphodiesterase class I)